MIQPFPIGLFNVESVGPTPTPTSTFTPTPTPTDTPTPTPTSTPTPTPTAEPDPLPSGLVVNLWQGDYVEGSTTWTNSAAGSTAVVSNMPVTGYTKNATGLVMTGSTTGERFRIASDGVWDNNLSWTVVTNMWVTSTSNRNFWGKQSSSGNGMGVLFTNNPFVLLRAPSSSFQISTASTTLRGARYIYSQAVTTPGAPGDPVTDAQWWLNDTAETTNISGYINNQRTKWNNGYNFTFGECFSFNDPAIQGYLNRLMIFNKRLTNEEISQVVDYCEANL